MSAAEPEKQMCAAEELQIALAAETQMRRDAEERLRLTKQEFEDFVLRGAHEARVWRVVGRRVSFFGRGSEKET